MTELAEIFYEHGDENGKRRAVAVALICWAEQIRRDQPKGDETNAVPCTLPK